MLLQMNHSYQFLPVLHCKTNVIPMTLSRDFVLQLYRVTKLQHATVHVAHCNFVAKTSTDEADWSVVIYATKSQCATCTVAYCKFLRDKVARQNRAIKLQV